MPPWEKYRGDRTPAASEAAPPAPVAGPWERYSGAANVPDQRIAGAFEDAANQPETRLSTDPTWTGHKPNEYGFRDYVSDALPFGDEVAALGGAIGQQAAELTGRSPADTSFGESYNRAKALRGRYREEYQAEHPAASAAGTGLSIATVGPGKLAATLPGQIRQGIVGGGGLGAIYGAGEGDTLQERGENALKSGAIGAGAGAVLPPVIAGVGGAARRVFAPVSSTLGNRLTPQHRATQLIEKNLRRDNVPVAEAARRMQSNPDLVLADVAGSNTRGLARTAVNTPGAAREEITQFVYSRNLNQPARIVDATRNILRNPDDFNSTVTQLLAERESVASPIYDQAFRTARPVNVWSVVKHIDKELGFGGRVTPQELAEVSPDGITGTLLKIRKFFRDQGRHNMDLRQLHQIKMELDDMIGTAMRAGSKTKAGKVIGVKNELLRVMDRRSRLYQRARGITSSSHEMEEALDIGRNIFRMGEDEVKQALKGMTPAEREMVQIGSARAIYDKSRGRDGRDIVVQIFGSQETRGALRAAFQDEAAFRRFRNVMRDESWMRRTSEGVVGNSTTARQAADLLDANFNNVGRDVLTQLLEGRVFPAVATAVRQAIFGEAGINEKVAERIARMLLSNDPKSVIAALRALSKREGAVERLAAALDAAQKLVRNEAAANSSKVMAR